MFDGVATLKKKSISTVKKMTPLISRSMGIIILIYAVLAYYSRCKTMGVNDAVVPYLSLFASTVFAILILIDQSNNVNRAVGLYAMAIGIDRIVKWTDSLNPPHGIVFVFAIVMIGFCVNLIVTGFFFLRGYVRCRPGMMFGTCVLFFLNGAWILFMMFNLEIPFETIALEYPDTIVLLFIYALLIYMLNTEQIRKSSDEERYDSVLSSIRKITACEEGSLITKQTADVLSKAFDNRSEWKKIENGPAECEYDFTIIHTVGDYSYVTVQKWKDNDNLFFTVSDHKEGTIIDAYRFNVDVIDESVDDTGRRFISMYNKDGLFIRLMVRE